MALKTNEVSPEGATAHDLMKIFKRRLRQPIAAAPVGALARRNKGVGTDYLG